ncbi:MAG: hypothetical protein ACI8UO_000059 [Verrucomicrobiales bacterium]|jgi:hypothetical protein
MNRSDDQFESTQKLIALKRYETPGDAYFETFFEEFKERQRAEILKITAWQLLRERLDTWLSGWHGYRWLAAGAGAICAAVITAIAISPEANRDESNPAATQIAAVEQAAPSSLLREF